MIMSFGYDCLLLLQIYETQCLSKLILHGKILILRTYYVISNLRQYCNCNYTLYYVKYWTEKHVQISIFHIHVCEVCRVSIHLTY